MTSVYHDGGSMRSKGSAKLVSGGGAICLALAVGCTAHPPQVPADPPTATPQTKAVVQRTEAAAQPGEKTVSIRGDQYSQRHLSGRNDTIPSKVTTPYPTLIHLAVEWEIEGDDNLNGVVTVRYRKAGDARWKRGLSLRRVPAQTWYNTPPSNAPAPDQSNTFHFTWANKHAGSLFDLQPDTEYEIALQLKDPDGGEAERTVRAKTRPVPQAMPHAPIKQVNPSTFVEAVADAQPGDVLVLEPGYYGYFAMRRDGETGKPIVIRSKNGDAIYLPEDNLLHPSFSGPHREGEVIFAGISLAGRKHVQLEGLVSFGTVTLWNTEECMVRRCRVYGIWGITASASQALARWQPDVAARLTPYPNTKSPTSAKNCYIADNIIIGVTPWAPPTLGNTGKNMGEGIEVTGPGNVICHNRVVGFRDNISIMEGPYAVEQHSIDIYNNDIEAAVDDGIEADYYMSNCRILRNRLTNCFRGISAGPGFGGPIYIVRNLLYNLLVEPFDLNRAGSGGVVVHNTWVKAGPAASWNFGASHMYFRNNLGIGGKRVGSSLIIMPPAAGSYDHDYNGFGMEGAPLRVRSDGREFTGIEDLRASTREKHAVEVGLNVFAAPVEFPFPPFPARPPQDLRLKAGSAAVDAGEYLPGINDKVSGKAPDLGAYERYQELPVYGPRRHGVDEWTKRESRD